MAVNARCYIILQRDLLTVLFPVVLSKPVLIFVVNSVLSVKKKLDVAQSKSCYIF